MQTGRQQPERTTLLQGSGNTLCPQGTHPDGRRETSVRAPWVCSCWVSRPGGILPVRGCYALCTSCCPSLATHIPPFSFTFPFGRDCFLKGHRQADALRTKSGPAIELRNPSP